MANPTSLRRPPAGKRLDPTAIDATGTTLGDYLGSVDDGSGGKRAGFLPLPSGSTYTDEQAQDAIGGMVADTATINATYTDATPELKFDVIPGGIKLDDLGTPDDTTDLDVSTSRHGLAPKAPADNTKFLRGDGSWAVPGVSGSVTFAGARAYHNANQSIADVTTTALALNSERYDTDAYHDTSTNNSRLTIPSGKAGYYHIGASVNFGPDSDGFRLVYIRLNGTTPIAVQGWKASDGGNITYVSLSTDYLLAVGDYVEIIVFLSAGNSLNVEVNGNYSPEFWLHLIGA
jgi:hypothetical protein